jgi:hypothetical protein
MNAKSSRADHTFSQTFGISSSGGPMHAQLFLNISFRP